MPVKVDVVPPPPANSKQPGVTKSLLYNGSRFQGSQKSKGNSYDVEVVLQVSRALLRRAPPPFSPIIDRRLRRRYVVTEIAPQIGERVSHRDEREGMATREVVPTLFSAFSFSLSLFLFAADGSHTI